MPLVGLLVLSGARARDHSPGKFYGALIDTRYGIILSIKLVLVALLLALAGTEPVCRHARHSCGRGYDPLLGTVLLECLVVICILAVGRRLAFCAAAARVGRFRAGAARGPYQPRRRCFRC